METAIREKLARDSKHSAGNVAIQKPRGQKKPSLFLLRKWADTAVGPRKWQSWPIVVSPTDTSAMVRKSDDGHLYMWVSSSGRKVYVKRVG